MGPGEKMNLELRVAKVSNRPKNGQTLYQEVRHKRSFTRTKEGGQRGQNMSMSRKRCQLNLISMGSMERRKPAVN